MAPDLHHKTFTHPIKPHLIAVAPTLDLIAAVIAADLLEVVRFDGQRAFAYRRSGSHSIESLTWRPDGKQIALAWSNGEIQVLEVKRGKPVWRFEVTNSQAGRDARRAISTGWGMNVIDPAGASLPLRAKQTAKAAPRQSLTSAPPNQTAPPLEPLTLEDFTAYIANHSVAGEEHAVTDLPNALSQITIESELPRLSALPPGDDTLLFEHGSELFANQELLDQATAPSKPVGPTYPVDSLLVHTGDGQMRIYFYGGYPAVDVQADVPDDAHVVAHASHAFSTTHLAVLQDKSGRCGVQRVDLDAIRLSKHFFPLLCQQTSSLESITAYIAQTIVILRRTWCDCQDLPRRWLEMGQEDVKAGDNIDLVPALYSLAMTGDCTPALKEWLVQIIGDRNHKRWDQAGTVNYKAIIDLTQRHLLPALDHASIRASRLRSLARTPSILIFNIEDRHLNRILADLDIIRLIAHRMVLHARLESLQFHVFSTWLKHQIVLQGAEPGSTTEIDASEKIAGIDHSILLPYLTEALTRSRLHFFLSRDASSIKEAARRPGQQTKLSFLVQILDRHAEKLLQPAGDLPEVANLLYQGLFLMDSVDEVRRFLVAEITKHTRVNLVVWLEGQAAAEKTDLRIVCTDDDTFAAYILVVTQGKSIVYKHDLGAEKAAPQTVLLPTQPTPGETVRDQKFLDDTTCLVLVNKGDVSVLQRITYRVGSDEDGDGSVSAPQTVTELQHKDLGWKPESLKVTSDKQKVRALVLSDDGKAYTIVTWQH